MMACPVDSTPLQMSERQGVEIDYCPTCRGVWLDRGELDKILERGAGLGGGRPERSDRGYQQQRESYGSYPPKKKKKGFLDEIFDF